LLVRAGIIKDLQKQVKFELQPAFRNIKGEAIRKIEYIPDFVYFDNEAFNKLMRIVEIQII